MPVLNCTWINAKVEFNGELLGNIRNKVGVNAVRDGKVLVQVIQLLLFSCPDDSNQVASEHFI